MLLNDKPLGFGRRLVLSLVLVAFAVGIVLAWVALSGLVAAGLHQVMAPEWAAIGGVLAFGSLLPVMLVGSAVVLVVNRGRLRAHLDGAVGWAGLDGVWVGSLGRHYHGTVDGRRVDLTVQRGPLVQLWLEVPTGTRAAVVEPLVVQRALAGLAGAEPLPMEGLEGLDGLEARGRDPEWLGQLLRDPVAGPALGRLARYEEVAGIRSVSVAPSAVLLSLQRAALGAVTESRLRAWLADLSAVAAAIEALGPVRDGALEESKLERLARTDSRTLHRRIGCILWGIVGGFLLLSVPFAILVAVFA